MQVLTPQDFSRMVFSATGTPQASSFNPQHHFKSPIMQPIQINPVFQAQAVPPPVAPKPVHREPAHSTFAASQIDHVSDQIRYLESEVDRMSDELRMRVESSKRERQARDKLTKECESLRGEVSKMKSLLHTREQQIYEIERQLSVSQSQLVLMKRRYLAAVEAAKHSTPGTIKHVHKDQVSIGVQVDEIRGLEERILKLTYALKEERNRNKRVKHLLLSEGGEASVPPVPIASRSRSRGTSTPQFEHRRSNRQLVVESIPLAYIHKRKSRLSNDQFTAINCRSLSVPPQHEEWRSESPNFVVSPIHHRIPATLTAGQSPSMFSDLHPRGAVFRSGGRGEFEVFQDSADLISLSPPAVSRQAGLRDSTNSNRGASVHAGEKWGSKNFQHDAKNRMRSAAQPGNLAPVDEFDISSPRNQLRSTRPPPFVPALNLRTNSRQESSQQPPSTSSSSSRYNNHHQQEIPQAARSGRPNTRPDTTTSSSLSSSSVANHSSEDAIKRAVAAAIEKRKQLAAMGVSVGSRSSSISSFMSDYAKPRFGCFLG